MRTLGPGATVLCSGTLARRTPFAERLAAASAAGFDGISLWGRDYRTARDEGLTDADLVAMLDHHGLAVAELDPAWWWLPGADQVHIPPALDEMDVFGFAERELFAIADALGARSLNAVDVFGGAWGTEEAAAALAGLADRAAEHGLLVHLEFLPWSRIPDVATAWEIVRLADRPNAGLAVDSWHFFRGRPDLAALGAVPGHAIMNVQWDDGPARPEPEPMTATLHERRLPGQGDFDLGALAATLRASGTTCPYGVEVFSDELHARPAAEAAAAAFGALGSLLAP